MRIASLAAMLGIGLWLNLAVLQRPDFIQDYASACASLRGLDPYSSLRELVAICDPGGESYGNLPTNAHPPFSVLLVLPLALFPWEVAHTIFLVLMWLAVVTVVLLAQPSRWLLASLVLIGAFSLATFEPLLVLLLVLAAMAPPVGAGALIGLAAGIKVYPVLFLVPLLWRREWAAVLACGGVGLLTLVLGEMLVGGTLDWLRFSGENAAIQAEMDFNMSLARILTPAGISVTVTMFWLFAVLAAPLLLQGRRLTDFVPAMLMSAPIVWPHYCMFFLAQQATWWPVAAGIALHSALWLVADLTGTSEYLDAAVVYGPLLIGILLGYVQMLLRIGEEPVEV